MKVRKPHFIIVHRKIEQEAAFEAHSKIDQKAAFEAIKIGQKAAAEAGKHVV